MMRRPLTLLLAAMVVLPLPSVAEETAEALPAIDDGGPFPTGDIGETLYTDDVFAADAMLADDTGGVTIYQQPLSDPPPLPDRMAATGGEGLLQPTSRPSSGVPMLDLSGDPGMAVPLGDAPVIIQPVMEQVATPVFAADPLMVEPVMIETHQAETFSADPFISEPFTAGPLSAGLMPMESGYVELAPAPVMIDAPAPYMMDAAPVIHDPVPVDITDYAYAPAMDAFAADKPGAAEMTRRSGAGPEMSMRRYARSVIDAGGEGIASQNAIVNVSKAAVVKIPADAKEVVVSDPTVVNAILRTARQTVLIGLKVGQTNAFFFDEDGGQILNLEIRVEPDLRPLQITLEETFPGNDLSVEALLGEVILRGRASSPAESQRIVSIVRRYIAASRASSSSEGGGAAAEEIEVVNRLDVAGEDQVLLKVRIAEMKRSVVKQFGVDWSVTGDILGNLSAGTGGFTSSSSFGVNGALLGGLTGNLFAGGDGGGLNTLIKAFERHGLVRILAEPTLTAVTGETASFLAGGQFPFPVSVENGQVGFEFRDFGVALEFAPVVLDGGRISLRIATEVSELTSEGSLSTTGGITIPGISVRRANTVVELPSGGTMSMAGLIQQKDSADHAGLPGLKNLPVLGQLFSSSDFKRSETELVILVTPYVATHGQENDFQLPTEGVPPPSDSDFYLLGRLHAVYGGAKGDYTTARKALHAPLGFILD